MPKLNFGQGISQEGVTNAGEKPFDLSNLGVIPKKQEEKTLDISSPISGPGATAPIQEETGLPLGINDIDTDLQNQLTDLESGITGGEEPPVFNIETEESDVFERLANTIIPTAQAKEFDEEKIKRFIEHGKSAGKSREEIRVAYDKGLALGSFDLVGEEVTDTTEVPEGFKESVGKIQESIGAGIETFKDPGLLGIEKQVRIGGEINKIKNEVIGIAFTEYAPDWLKDLGKTIAESDVGQSMGLLSKMVTEYGDEAEKIFPRLTKDIKGLLGTAELATDFIGGAAVIKAVPKVVKGVGVIPTKISNKLFPEASLDDIVLKVSQGKAKDVAKFKKALGQIDTTEIKTYNDLNKAFDDKVSELAKKQDELLPTEAVHKVEDLTTTVGKRKTNFIEESLNDLEKVGKAENDLELLSKVDSLKEKTLVSTKDINDLARFYGSKFKSKAFDKAGNQKSSLTASRFENNRSGLKDVSRELLPDDTVKALDSELSSLYTSKELTGKMTDKVNDLLKKIDERGLIETIARGVGKGIDIATFGGPRAFLSSFLPSNVGNKILNSLDIQENLSKHLKTIEKLTKKGAKVSDDVLIKETQKILSPEKQPDIKSKDIKLNISNIKSYNGKALTGKTNAWNQTRYDDLYKKFSKGEEQKMPIKIYKNNGKYEIDDGNHRFEALKDLGRDIKAELYEDGVKTDITITNSSLMN